MAKRHPKLRRHNRLIVPASAMLQAPSAAAERQRIPASPTATTTNSSTVKRDMRRILSTSSALALVFVALAVVNNQYPFTTALGHWFFQVLGVAG